MGGGQSLARRKADWEEYLKDARTGDLILWSSSGDEAKLVRFATGSYYSHIGIVLRFNKGIQPGDSGIYFYHSPSGPIKGLNDQFSNPPKPKEGPQLNDLRTTLSKCRNVKSIEVRRLVIDESVDHPWKSGILDADTDPTVAFAREEHSKVYERSTGELFRSVYDGPGGENTEDLSSYFCSELVAELLKRAKVLVTQAPSNEFTPANFSSYDERETPLATGFYWEPELKLTFDGTYYVASRSLQDHEKSQYASPGAGAGAGAGGDPGVGPGRVMTL